MVSGTVLVPIHVAATASPYLTFSGLTFPYLAQPCHTLRRTEQRSKGKISQREALGKEKERKRKERKSGYGDRQGAEEYHHASLVDD